MEEYSYKSTHPLGHTGPVTESLYLLYTQITIYNHSNYYNSYQRMHTILMNSQYHNTSARTLFRSSLVHHHGARNMYELVCCGTGNWIKLCSFVSSNCNYWSSVHGMEDVKKIAMLKNCLQSTRFFCAKVAFWQQTNWYVADYFYDYQSFEPIRSYKQ